MMMKKSKILLALIFPFLAFLTNVSALESNFWGKNVKTPLEVYFRDCTSTTSCPTVLSNVNGVGYFNDSYSNLSTSFDVYLGSNFGIQSIFKPEQSLVKNMLYNLSIYSCSSGGSNTSSVLNLLNLTTGSTISEVMNYSNSINIVSSSSSVISDRPFNYFILSEGTPQMTLFDTCSMYNVLFVPSKNSNYIGAHNKVNVGNTTDFTFLGYNIENLGQYNQLSADQIQNIVSNNNEVIKQQIDQMNNSISNSLDDLKDQQQKNNQELIEQNKQNWKDNMQNCRDSKNLLVISDNNYCNSSNCVNFKKGIGTPNFTNISGTFVIRVDLASPLTLDPGTYTINVFTGENYPYFNLYSSNKDLIAAASNGDFGRKTFTLTSTTTISYLTFYYGSTNLSYGEIKPILYVGSDSISFEPPGEICTNKIDDVQHSLTDDNVDGADNSASNFFSNFQTDTYGLSSIITAPLNLIESLTSTTCQDLVLPLPFVNKNLTLPCMTKIYQQNFGTFFTIYQTITFGIISYWVIVRIFNLIKDFKNPDHDEIEVMDL